jgi:hypothetical protein
MGHSANRVGSFRHVVTVELRLLGTHTHFTSSEGSLLATEAHADSFFHYQMQYYAARRPTIQEEQVGEQIE